jgi:hypothetical protein
MPRRGGRLEALLAVAAILVIVATMALMTRGVLAPATGGAQDVHLKAGAGTAVVHDDAGNMPISAGSSVVHDDAGNVKPVRVRLAWRHTDRGPIG